MALTELFFRQERHLPTPHIKDRTIVQPLFKESEAIKNLKEKEQSEFVHLKEHLQEQKLVKYLPEGKDHVVKLIEIDGILWVKKRLKNTSREAQVFIGQKKPEQIYLSTEQVYPDSNTISSEQLILVLERMQQFYYFVKSILGSVILTTYFDIESDESGTHIVKYQRFIPESSANDPLVQREKILFINKMQNEWIKLQRHQMFQRLPNEVKLYYRYFGFDHGCSSNVILRGIGMSPPFWIIDY